MAVVVVVVFLVVIGQEQLASVMDGVGVLFCSLAVLDPRVGHTMDVLFPFIPVLCHSD